jgi:branched-subunit amino acid permease
MLFSMFFGAGNLIFPPFLGSESGTSYWLAMSGFIITGVGLPFVVLLAVSPRKGRCSNHRESCSSGIQHSLYGYYLSMYWTIPGHSEKCNCCV